MLHSWSRISEWGYKVFVDLFRGDNVPRKSPQHRDQLMRRIGQTRGKCVEITERYLAVGRQRLASCPADTLNNEAIGSGAARLSVQQSNSYWR